MHDIAMQSRYDGARTLTEFVADAVANRELWIAFTARASAPADLLARVNALPTRRHLLVLAEDWCGDAVNTIPALGALVDGSHTLDMRLLSRDANPELMSAHLTAGSRSMPVVIVLDEHFQELGWWGPRPSPLQKWVLSEGVALEKTARYREVRRWYARDHARTTLNEIVTLLERHTNDLAARADVTNPTGITPESTCPFMT